VSSLVGASGWAHLAAQQAVAKPKPGDYVPGIPVSAAALSGFTPSVIVVLAASGLEKVPLAFEAFSLSTQQTLMASTGGDLRKALQAAALCAGTGTDSVRFSRNIDGIDGHWVEEQFSGIFGLYPEWFRGPMLDLRAQRHVSACVASLVSRSGVSLTDALLQAAPLPPTPPSSVMRYGELEGIFEGNLWARDGPVINACFFPTSVANSRSWQRTCATGIPDVTGAVVECSNIHIVGNCPSQTSPTTLDFARMAPESVVITLPLANAAVEH